MRDGYIVDASGRPLAPVQFNQPLPAVPPKYAADGSVLR